jgi:hypothetical protein
MGYDVSKKLDIKRSRPIEVCDRVYVFKVTDKHYGSGVRVKAIVLATSGWCKKRPENGSQDEYRESMRVMTTLSSGEVFREKEGAANLALAILTSKGWEPAVVSRAMVEGFVEDINPILQEAAKVEQAWRKRADSVREQIYQILPGEFYTKLRMSQAEAVLKIFNAIDGIEAAAEKGDMESIKREVDEIRFWQKQELEPENELQKRIEAMVQKENEES